MVTVGQSPWDDIKTLELGLGHLISKSQVRWDTPLPPAEFHVKFDDGEDMLLGRGEFDGICEHHLEKVQSRSM